VNKPPFQQRVRRLWLLVIISRRQYFRWSVGGSVKFPTFNYSLKTYVRQAKTENLFRFVKSTQKQNAKICVKII